MSNRSIRTDSRRLLAGFDRTLLAAVPLPLRRLAGFWLLGLSLSLPSFAALFR